MRQELLSKVLKVGSLAGLLGIFSEYFYYKDYWHPPGIFGPTTIALEDFVLAFAITALSFITYVWIFSHKFSKPIYPVRYRLYLLFFVAGLSVMFLFNSYLGFNSVLVSSAVFVLFSVVMMLQRRDLIRVSLYSVGVIILYIIGVYIILFDVLSPQFWDRYWLLANTKLGITILGNIPLTEIIWYISWILFASISYPYVSGRAIKPAKQHTRP